MSDLVTSNTWPTHLPLDFDLSKAQHCWQIWNKTNRFPTVKKMEIPLGGFHVKTQFINRFYLFTLNWKAKEHEKNVTLPFGESFLLGESIDPQIGGEKTRTRQMYVTTSKQVFCWSHVFVRGFTIVSNSLFVFFQGENRMYHYLREKIQWTKKPGFNLPTPGWNIPEAVKASWHWPLNPLTLKSIRRWNTPPHRSILIAIFK